MDLASFSEKPYSAALFAMHSRKRKKYAGALPERDVILSIPSSESTHTVLPQHPKRSSANFLSASDAPAAGKRPAMPRPMRAGVFGITRTIRVKPGTSSAIRPVVTPAIIDISSFLLKSMPDEANCVSTSCII